MAVYLALWLIVHDPSDTDRRDQIHLVISPSFVHYVSFSYWVMPIRIWTYLGYFLFFYFIISLDFMSFPRRRSAHRLEAFGNPNDGRDMLEINPILKH